MKKENKIKSLIIGAGSIGLRHVQILNDLGHETALITKRKDINSTTFTETKEGIKKFIPDYIIVANETNKHIKELKDIILCGFKKKVLIEKPISNDLDNIKSFDFNKDNIFVGYNLRYHPCINFIKDLLTQETVLSANIYVGQYLPDWRPNRDYKTTYSSDYKKGGGVLLELSHEIDYMIYLFGKCNKSYGLASKLSDLDINCDDSVVGYLEFQKCKHVSFNFNLLDRQGRREIILNTNKSTFKIDLFNNEIVSKVGKKTFHFNKNETYKNMHLDILNNDGKIACKYYESIETINLINKIKTTNKQNEEDNE